MQRREWKREGEASGSQRRSLFFWQNKEVLFFPLEWRKKKEQKISLFLPPGRSVKPNQCLFWRCGPSPRLRLTKEETLGRYTSRFQSASCGTGPTQTERGGNNAPEVFRKSPREVRTGLAWRSKNKHASVSLNKFRLTLSISSCCFKTGESVAEDKRIVVREFVLVLVCSHRNC